MTLEEFTKLVRKMRTEQKRFFDGVKTQSQVKTCQALEKRVDDALDVYEKKLGTQTSLF